MRQLDQASSAMGVSLERLSSGLRINRASDDAAGLSVASVLSARARVFTQGIRNLNDGVSALAIAEGALVSLRDIVMRQRELAEQAANGTYAAFQRESLQRESDALTDEFNRIVEATTFNGRRLLDGSFQGVMLQAGIGEGASLEIATTASLVRLQGDGTFTTMSPVPTGVAAGLSLGTTGDFNGDGYLDLIVGGSNAVFFAGDGSGGFASGVSTGIGAFSGRGVVTDDINGDGHLDLVTAGSNVQVAFGDGNGAFTLSQNFGGSAQHVTLADMNGDGIKDIIATDSNAASGAFRVNFGIGGGQFGATQFFGSSSPGREQRFLATADFDNDGRMDVVTSEFTAGARARVFLNRGTHYDEIEIALSNQHDIGVGDFDRDGNVDLVVSGQPILLGNGDGTFRQGAPIALLSADRIRVLDQNGDGYDDIIVNPFGIQPVRVFIGNGDGSFSAPTLLATTAAVQGSQDLLTGDFNNDGVIDLVRTSTVGSSNHGVFLGNGAASTKIAHHYLVSAEGARGALEDTERILSKIAQDVSLIGAYQSRITIAIEGLSTSRENELAAASRIQNADIAEESAELTRNRIRQAAAAAVLTQANLQPELALKLLAP